MEKEVHRLKEDLDGKRQNKRATLGLGGEKKTSKETVRAVLLPGGISTN